MCCGHGTSRPPPEVLAWMHERRSRSSISTVPKYEGSFGFARDGHPQLGKIPVETGATSRNPMTGEDRFSLAMSQIVGRRLTYTQLTGQGAD